MQFSVSQVKGWVILWVYSVFWLLTSLHAGRVYGQMWQGLPHFLQPGASWCVFLFSLLILFTGFSLEQHKILLRFFGCLRAGIGGAGNTSFKFSFSFVCQHFSSPTRFFSAMNVWSGERWNFPCKASASRCRRNGHALWTMTSNTKRARVSQNVRNWKGAQHLVLTKWSPVVFTRFLR